MIAKIAKIRKSVVMDILLSPDSASEAARLQSAPTPRHVRRRRRGLQPRLSGEGQALALR